MPIQNGINVDFSPLELGYPSACLLEAGLPNLPIQMAIRRLVAKKLQSNHPFPLYAVVSMPEYIGDPIAVFQSKTRRDCLVILTEMEYKENNLVVIIEPDKKFEDSRFNSVRSVYPKDNFKDVLKWVCEDILMRYYNKEKILKWLDKQQSNSADVIQLLKDCIKIIK